MTKLTAMAWLPTTVDRQTPSAVDTNINTEALFLVFRDGLEQRIGPYRVIDINEKMVHVDHWESLGQYSMNRCKVYKIEDEVEAIMTDLDDAAAVAHWDDRWTGLHAELHENDFCAIPGIEKDLSNILFVRVIKCSVPRSKEPEFIVAKQKRTNELKSRNIWTRAKVSDLPTDWNIVGGSFELTLKNDGTPNKTEKVW